MKKESKNRYLKSNVKTVAAVMTVVLLMILIFFSLTRKGIVTLSKDMLTLESKNYSEELGTWADQILNELNIYKSIAEEMGLDDAKAFDMLKTSCGPHEAYPYGLYWGDENGNYFDSSGWVPGEDFVVTERNWYLEGLEHDEFAFGEPYMDAMTGEACISVTSRVDGGSAVSVMAADVYFDYAQRLVESITSNKIENAFFVTGGGRIIVADSNTAMVGKSIDDEGNPLLYRNISLLIESDTTGQSRIKGENGSYFANINKIGNTNWYFVTWMSRKEVLRELRRIELIMLAVALAAVMALVFLTHKAAREIGENKVKARTDPLTRLLNRDGFREIMFVALDNSPDQGVMLFMDMDNFKQVNDELGHSEGDNVLKRFAALLDGYFNRNKDVVARIGGDEFVVFVGRAVGRNEVNEMLKKFIGLFHKEFDGAYEGQRLSVSIGAAFAADTAGYKELYQSADGALYEVKRRGKDGYCIMEPPKDECSSE